MKEKLHPVLSVRIFREEKCFGPGIAELLRRVDRHHSLRAAAKSMGMAYSKAWSITKKAEAGLGFPLLIVQTGGKNGGGAALTEDAVRLLRAYDSYCAKIRAYADAVYETDFSFLNEIK